MADYLQIPSPQGVALFVLESDRVTLGKDPSNTVVVDTDPTVSRMHAVLERFPAGWCVRDMSSRNGTFLNGERLSAERPLRSGDEIRVGSVRITFRSDTSAGASSSPASVATEAAAGPPELTRPERDVLVALCRPVLSGDVFTEPASTREVAGALYVSEAAVKQHLLRLYDKFGLYNDGDRKRSRLANEAVRRGAVSIADLRADQG